MTKHVITSDEIQLLYPFPKDNTILCMYLRSLTLVSLIKPYYINCRYIAGCLVTQDKNHFSLGQNQNIAINFSCLGNTVGTHVKIVLVEEPPF
jgi:hypothetical protein